MRKTYKFRINPTRHQIGKLEHTLDICRMLYNSCLIDRKNHYTKTGKGITRIRQQEILRSDKDKLEFLNDIHSQVLQGVLFRVDRAFKAFFRRLKDKSGKAGYPRLKSHGRYDSIDYPQQPGFQITPQGLNLSKIGTIKIKLHRSIIGTIKTCTIRRDIDRWYACISVEYEPAQTPVPIKIAGIDVGIESFAVLSDGKRIENPKYLKKSEKRLTLKQRRLFNKKRGSRNRNKARIKVARMHRTIRNQRSDFHHKASRSLIDSYGFLAVENLNIKGMAKNHCLAKSISDAGWGQFLNYLTYKAEEAGTMVESVAPHYTSIICSQCGAHVHKTLSIRVHTCPCCGLVIGRDHNAAINILKKSSVGTTLSYAWGDGLFKMPSLNQEAPSVRAG